MKNDNKSVSKKTFQLIEIIFFFEIKRFQHPPWHGGRMYLTWTANLGNVGNLFLLVPK